MKKNKTSISKARSYAQIGEFWDKHDLSDYWGKTRKVKFDVVLEPEATYYPVQKDLAEEIKSVARKQGVTLHPRQPLVRSKATGDTKAHWRAEHKEPVVLVCSRSYEPPCQRHWAN